MLARIELQCEVELEKPKKEFQNQTRIKEEDSQEPEGQIFSIDLAGLHLSIDGCKRATGDHSSMFLNQKQRKAIPC